MRRKTLLVLSVVLMVGIALSGCANLLPQDKEPLTGDFGSPYTPQEHQLRTFEALWKNVQENYIYFDTANVDWDTLHTKYTDQIKGGLTNDQFTTLLHDLESDLPAGTLAYQSRAERLQTDTIDNSTYGGIGAYIGFQANPEPHIVILAVMEGSPAEKAGIQAHDSLLKIDGSPILLEEGVAAVQRVRGPAGTTVELTIQSPGKAERVVEVKRAQLASTSKLETYEIKGKPYAYILIPPLAYDTLMDDIKSNLQTYTTNKTLKGLILDLRVAGSTRGWPLQDLFTIFQDGEIGEFYDRSTAQIAKITGQDVFGSRAFIETTSFRLPNGIDIGNKGVTPTFEIDAGWDDILPNNDPVLDKAIELLEAQP